MRPSWTCYLPIVLLSACASSPPEPHQPPEYQAYWSCAYNAAMGQAGNRQLTAHEAAMRAQAHCYPAYQRYQAAQERYSRSVVASQDQDMATNIAEHEAFAHKQAVTARLTRLVAQARE